jgi:hypothetical protein
MSVVKRVRDDIFAEPSGSQLNWLPIAFGVLSIGILILGLTDLYLEYVIMGMGFVFMGSADLISAERHQTAGILRLCSIIAFAILGLRYVEPVLM